MNNTKLILTMSHRLKNIKWGEYSTSFLLSVVFHLIIFISSAYLFSIRFEKSIANSVYLNFEKTEAIQKNETVEEVEKIEAEQEEIINEEPAGAFYNFNNTSYDTSDIKQVYKESTLNVSVRYPNGWTYIDQNVKNKLDGVTFWAVQGNYKIPPYVHLEVQDKYIFNPSRYEHKVEYKGSVFYYNNPEVMDDYFTQIIYIRTDSDEDYSLKLMVKGKETFHSFQPIFFSMAKSFSFGNTFF